MLETFRDKLFTEIFPGRSTVPKTLIFAKDDAHAEEIVTQVREVFGKGNDFAAKITYTARNADQQLAASAPAPALRIAVTVDMIATGTDVKPLECVFFMRDVRSPQYFEQMKGRGARTIPDADFQAVTPDAKEKTRFVLVDAVGVTEHDFVEPPLNREQVDQPAEAAGEGRQPRPSPRTRPRPSRPGSRPSKPQIPPSERAELDSVAGGSLRDRWCATSSTPSTRTPRPRPLEGADDPDEARQQLIIDAVKPLGRQPRPARPHPRAAPRPRPGHRRGLRRRPARRLRRGRHGKAKSVVESWRAYLDEHRSEITAIQLLTEAKERRISFGDIKELADRIARPPYNWTPDIIWNAYVALDPAVRRQHRAPHA